MLEDYKETQKDFYELATKIAVNKKVSHAYFIETSSFAGGKQLAVSFAKFLLCQSHYSNHEKCGTCNQCHLIDSGNFDDIYMIEPDGMWIKKEQILQLKEEFSNKSLSNNLRVYIIDQADKLNKPAANSMLKFLEEPEDNIVAILLADNRYNVINTILSRCQIYKLKNDISYTYDENKYNEMFDFSMNLERNGIKTICYMNSLWNSKYTTRTEIIENFDILQEIYMDVLNYQIKNEYKFNTHEDDIEYISKNNDQEKLLYKIKVINDVKGNIKYNLNLSLMMDKFIIDFVGGDNNE